MPEADTIHDGSLPNTVQTLIADLAACGLRGGQTVLVHCSMSRIGWIAGGAVALVQALLHVLGDDGTLMMPTHTADNSDPALWSRPPVPESWWPIIRAHMPAYDPAITPTGQMGRLAELFRTWPGVRRSAHPVVSFAALGKHADALIGSHRLEAHLGEGSPIAHLYDLDGHVLLIGVDHSNNTSLHLAEYRAKWHGKRWTRQGCAMLVNGERRWVEYQDLDWNDEDFPQLGDAFEAEHGLARGHIGAAEARFMRQRPLVDFGVRWIERNR